MEAITNKAAIRGRFFKNRTDPFIDASDSNEGGFWKNVCAVTDQGGRECIPSGNGFGFHGILPMPPKNLFVKIKICTLCVQPQGSLGSFYLLRT